MTDNTQSVSKKLIDHVGWLAAILFVFGAVLIVMTIRLDQADNMMAGFVAMFAGMMGGAIYRALKAISRH